MEPLTAGDPAQIGAYQLVGRLGATAQGRVYAGRGPDGRLSTVTLFHPQVAQDPRFRDQLRKEMAAARRMTGPYVLPVDGDTAGPTPWTAVGGADAPTLAQAVAENGPLPQHLLPDLAASLVGGFAALTSAGRQAGGIEPSHVVMTPEGAKLAVLGATLPSGGGRGAETDAVYVLGALLHFAGSGRPPAPPAGSWAPQPPPPVSDPMMGGLITECLSANPAARPTLRTLASRLQGATGRPVAVTRQPWWRGASGQFLAITAAMAVAATIALAAGGDDKDKGLSSSPAADITAPAIPSLPGVHKGLGDDDGSSAGSGSDDGLSGGSSGSDDSGGSGSGGDDSDDPVATPTDPIADAQVGDCFDNNGTATSPDLSPTYCGYGTFKTLKVINGTTDTHQCDDIPRDSWNVANLTRQVVLCLSYQYEHGTAYYAKPGACVYGSSATSDWNEIKCQTGAFTVLRRLTGTTDTSKCKNVTNDDWSEHFGVTGRSDLDVTLCLSMRYPDDAGHAEMNECMKMSGPSNRPVFHSSSCGAANVVINGRTSKYNAKSFCGNNGWSTWKPNDYPELAYTICYRWK
jgi:hypothetical protein